MPTNLFRVSLFVIIRYVGRSCPTDDVTLDICKSVDTKLATCLAVLLHNLVNVYKHFGARGGAVG